MSDKDRRQECSRTYVCKSNLGLLMRPVETAGPLLRRYAHDSVHGNVFCGENSWRDLSRVI